MRARTPREVIDQAIAENRFGERLLYGMAVAFAAIGLLVLVWAAVTREPVVAVAGSISSYLFWPAAKFARQTRKESIAIRLLEATLSRADTAAEAARMLGRLFDELMLEKRGTQGATIQAEAKGRGATAKVGGD
jgi:hypothetical protein